MKKTGTQAMLEQDFRSQLQDFSLQCDVATGLPNHISFRASLRRLLDEALTDGREIALVWIDIMNLRREFSISGDQGAERLVYAVADALRPCVETGELICRFGDRCFLLAVQRDEHTARRLSRMVEAAGQFDAQTSEGRPEIAAGVAYFPEHATTAGDLVRFASLAAVSAARSRSRSPILFHSEMNSALLFERDMERDLRTALRNDQLSLVYQPQIDLATGNVIGAEGLTRWNHPTRGPVSPLQFIPVAERSDLIDEIFRHSLRTVLADAARWRSAGLTIPSVSVKRIRGQYPPGGVCRSGEERGRGQPAGRCATGD
jgi:diguanylate cyclase (GGDEF)-like protein